MDEHFGENRLIISEPDNHLKAVHPLRILCFGDSNTWGYIPGSGERYPKNIRWTGVFACVLDADCEIIEEGLNGRTTVWDDPIEGDKNGLAHLPMLLESHKPLDMIIIMLGTNDLKARFSLTAYDIAGGVERLVQIILLSKCGIANSNPAILIACPPRVNPQNDLSEMFSGAIPKSKNLPDRYNQIAEKYNCVFLDLNMVLKVDNMDGIHYSPQAHRILGSRMADLVSSYFSLK